MARHLWAKIRVDLRHHPKLIGRPDGDFRLWTSLLLHAKEYCPDGIVRELGAAEMRSAWGIKSPTESVRKALDYFIRQKMLIEVSEGFLIRDFVEEQRVTKDSPEAALERQRRKREKDRGPPHVTGAARDITRDTDRDKPRDGSVTRHADLDLDQDQDLRSDLRVDPAAGARTDQGGTDWPKDLLGEVQKACGKTDLDKDWQVFVGRTLRAPKEKRDAGARAFLAGGYAQSKSDPLSYCAVMIERSTGRPPEVNGNGHRKHESGVRVVPSAAETEALMAADRAKPKASAEAVQAAKDKLPSFIRKAMRK